MSVVSLKILRSLLMSFLLIYQSDSLSNEYAGSTACKTCHVTIYNDYIKSGHPYKLNAVKGAPPQYPLETSPGVPTPPQGYSWNDISYVIGGFGWKARFMDKQGYILIGPGTQYNLANAQHQKEAHWVAYDGNSHSTKPYSCGACHTTGWEKTGAKGPHQHGLKGIHGTWSEPGVTCEACHGPAAKHVTNPGIDVPVVENCRQCHSRGDVSKIDAGGGLIRHHEQYETLLASPHKALPCSACHNPHQSTRYNKGGYLGDDKTCKSCHGNVQVKLQSKEDMACHECHMPYVVKSAIKSEVKYQAGSISLGDLRTHIHRISTEPNWKMFTDDGKFVRKDSEGRAHLTVDHVCLSCHMEANKDWALKHSNRIH